MAFTDQDIVDIRRYCGYGMFGTGQNSMQYWHFYQHYATLEWRIENLSETEMSVIADTYLPTMRQLETDIATARTNLDTDRAAVWVHNDNEISDRVSLLMWHRRELCNMLELPPGPFLGNTGNTMRVVV